MSPGDRYPDQLAYDLMAVAAAVEGVAPGAVTIPVTTDEPVSAWQVLASDLTTGGAVVAQPMLDVVVLGIAIQSGLSGATVNVVRTGTYVGPWNWSPGVPIICGTDGALTQTLPDDAQVVQSVGLAVTPTRMLVRIDPPQGV